MTTPFIVVAAIACGDDDQNAHADEFVEAVRENDVAYCRCFTRGDSCAVTEFQECAYDVLRRRAHELGTNLECSTVRTMELTSCFETCATLEATTMTFEDVNACAMRAPEKACAEATNSVRESIEAEIDEHCMSLVRCPDGSPLNEHGGCPIPLPDAGPPQPSCASELSSMAEDTISISPACAQCTCEAWPDALSICDASCWALLACIQEQCSGADAGPIGECLAAHCESSMQTLADAVTIADTFSRACRDECAPLGGE